MKGFFLFSGLALKRIRNNNNDDDPISLQKVILLVRNPLEAALAELTRKKTKGSHRGKIKDEDLLRSDE